mgnify:CR=1 FL=1
MKPDYKNWVPKGMIRACAAGAAVTAAICAASSMAEKKVLGGIAGTAAIGLTIGTGYLAYLHNTFSYDGKRKLSKTIVEGVASYVTVPDGGKCLDVGCGSGALTIACAKRNPNAQIIGIDRWGKEYSSYNKPLCERNAQAEGVSNVTFQQGNALKLDFPDETFDAVTSNYVYHNITSANKQGCLRETLRVLKKGGTFAIHDIMTPARYGDMDAFVRELKDAGYEKVELIKTCEGMFLEKKEALFLDLAGSTLLTGIK